MTTVHLPVLQIENMVKFTDFGASLIKKLATITLFYFQYGFLLFFNRWLVYAKVMHSIHVL